MLQCGLRGGTINAMTTIVEPDSRKRVTLGTAATAERYILTVEPGGVIVLSPAVVMTEEESRLLARPDILEAAAKARERAEAGDLGAAPPVRRKA